VSAARWQALTASWNCSLLFVRQARQRGLGATGAGGLGLGGLDRLRLVSVLVSVGFSFCFAAVRGAAPAISLRRS